MEFRNLLPFLLLPALTVAQTQEHAQHQHAPPPAQEQPKPPEQQKKVGLVRHG